MPVSICLPIHDNYHISNSNTHILLHITCTRVICMHRMLLLPSAGRLFGPLGGAAPLHRRSRAPVSRRRAGGSAPTVGPTPPTGPHRTSVPSHSATFSSLPHQEDKQGVPRCKKTQHNNRPIGDVLSWMFLPCCSVLITKFPV